MALIYWRGQAGTGHGDIREAKNWASSPTTPFRLSSIAETDDAIFAAGAYPAGARINSTGNFRVRSIQSDESSPTATIYSVSAYPVGIQIVGHSSVESKFSSKLSFEGTSKRGITLTLYENTTLSFEGFEENYKGLDYLATYGNGVVLKSSIDNPKALRNLRFSVGGGSLDLSNAFTHFKGFEVTSAGSLQNLKNNTIIIDPTYVIDQAYDTITARSGSDYSNLNVVLSNNQIPNTNQIFKATAQTLELASLTLLNVNELEVNGALEVSGKLQIDKINKLSISDGGSVRASGTFESTAVGTELVSAGWSANFAVGPARAGAHTGAVEVDEWKIKNVQSDSRNITTVGGTLTGNTTGFAYREPGELPVIETRATTSTINPIAFGIVKTTEELTKEVRYTVEPIEFSVAAKGSKVLIEDRTITSTINPIEFSVTSIPMKQQIEERLVEIMVSPIMVSATARELKIKTGKRAVNIQSSPIKFSATGAGIHVKSKKYTTTSTIGEIFLSVETIGLRVKNESREIISYVSPIRMKVTSYPLGVVKKYVAKVTVIDTKQPHFIYVAKNEPTIHVAKNEPTIKLI